MPNSVEIKEQIVEFVLTLTSGIDREALELHTGLLSAELVSSVEFIQLILFLEKKFCISIESDELVIENFDSVEAMTAFVQSALEK